jgi:membrane fusion protein, multidrug efflux system
MAAARDQAARMFRPEPETAESEPARDAAAVLAEQLRSQLPEETVARRAETPASPATEKPAAAPSAPAAAPEAPKSGKRKLVLMGVGILVALAAASYGVHYVLVGRFLVSTDDAYVRANSTTLGARVSGHIAAIIPGDNALVQSGDVIFRIDDGDYRIAVDAARTRIATQQATIDRIGRQVTALESAVEQAHAQVVSAEAALKRAGLDFDRQQALSTRGFASRATFEVSEAGRDQGVAGQCRSHQGAAGGGPRAACGVADFAGQGGTRPRLHFGARAGRGHLLQPSGQYRRFYRDRTTARQCGAAQ